MKQICCGWMCPATAVPLHWARRITHYPTSGRGSVLSDSECHVPCLQCLRDSVFVNGENWGFLLAEACPEQSLGQIYISGELWISPFRDMPWRFPQAHFCRTPAFSTYRDALEIPWDMSLSTEPQLSPTRHTLEIAMDMSLSGKPQLSLLWDALQRFSKVCLVCTWRTPSFPSCRHAADCPRLITVRRESRTDIPGAWRIWSCTGITGVHRIESFKPWQYLSGAAGEHKQLHINHGFVP